MNSGSFIGFQVVNHITFMSLEWRRQNLVHLSSASSVLEPTKRVQLHILPIAGGEVSLHTTLLMVSKISVVINASTKNHHHVHLSSGQASFNAIKRTSPTSLPCHRFPQQLYLKHSIPSTSRLSLQMKSLPFPHPQTIGYLCTHNPESGHPYGVFIPPPPLSRIPLSPDRLTSSRPSWSRCTGTQPGKGAPASPSATNAGTLRGYALVPISHIGARWTPDSPRPEPNSTRPPTGSSPPPPFLIQARPADRIVPSSQATRLADAIMTAWRDGVEAFSSMRGRDFFFSRRMRM